MATLATLATYLFHSIDFLSKFTLFFYREVILVLPVLPRPILRLNKLIKFNFFGNTHLLPMVLPLLPNQKCWKWEY